MANFQFADNKQYAKHENRWKENNGPKNFGKITSGRAGLISRGRIRESNFTGLDENL